MAHASHVFIFLTFSNLAIAMATLPISYDPYIGKCKSSCEEELNLSLYLHQVASGPAHNQEIILNPGFENSFGMVAVNDWEIHAAPDSTSSIIARAKGMHIQATKSQANGVAWFLPFSMVFQDSRFGGSTLEVMGAITSADGEFAIVGGTGKLSMACGTVKFIAIQAQSSSIENYRKIDIHAFYTPSLTV
ncbi:dirigent protein 21-like [Triticum dicoccoides]|uniref:dirigent protein 21-like n=1 Tax=Triticum dicoccoides TaxID=85692 RepID=UPI00188FA5B0|nr:dirigent protein 21-like [Triticum dicoccoides]